MLSKNKINKAFFLSAAFFSLLLTLSLFSCIDDGEHDAVATALEETSSSSELKLSFVIPNADVATRAQYEAGEGLENEINISDHDFRVYFFTYDENDENYSKGGTLLAEFTPNRTTSSTSSNETRYTVTGKVPDGLLVVDSFRVVVLANWGNTYPTSFSDGTTIDDLTEANFSTFTAANKFSLSSSQLIPFYGVQEFPGVEIKEGSTTTLDTPISLLRALAKVEVIMSEDSNIDEFDNVSIVKYNSQGFCAPKDVYTSKDYNADLSITPDDPEWSSVFVDELHLVGGVNNTISTPQSFTQVSSDGESRDTWYIYVPEYDNKLNIEDYSYIEVTIGNDTYPIYFSVYDSDGQTDNTNIDNRYNLKRNNLYRFYVEFTTSFSVTVHNWDFLGEEELTFNGM